MSDLYQWVNPKDRMPMASDADELGYVLVAFSNPKNPTVRVARYKDGMWSNPSDIVIHNPFAWMPMPRFSLGQFDGH